jgi:DNA-directed RNA polymerase subunit RPC12/RpoP
MSEINATTHQGKSDTHSNVLYKCSECNREFPRPGDFKKHNNSHSRPWTGSGNQCEYHTIGFPTHAELQRHEKDMHTLDPVQYKCLHLPCANVAMRDSNSKLHMESAHNYEYKRSKRNGHKKAPKTGGRLNEMSLDGMSRVELKKTRTKPNWNADGNQAQKWKERHTVLSRQSPGFYVRQEENVKAKHELVMNKMFPTGVEESMKVEGMRQLSNHFASNAAV